jgi:hypothetical protein
LFPAIYYKTPFTFGRTTVRNQYGHINFLKFPGRRYIVYDVR